MSTGSPSAPCRVLLLAFLPEKQRIACPPGPRTLRHDVGGGRSRAPPIPRQRPGTSDVRRATPVSARKPVVHDRLASAIFIRTDRDSKPLEGLVRAREIWLIQLVSVSVVDPSERGGLRDPSVSSHPRPPIKVVDLVHHFQQGLPGPRLWQDASGVVMKTVHSLEGSARHVSPSCETSTRVPSRKIPSTTGLRPKT